ncbi:hypothetical protein EMIHUDRAFT_104216 [Emiliania huxleyi CCMP1516]|uniref:Uncharacterized protein n=2 Tax=Emiliania huxleyi TaxID=2903 RepID=A0A0D3IM51_EMIH1|nr:hypothetical protein EMIHUDRAFT_104216 [Emiliania huxleyi CCMP1516]EOD12336.1 hypothetical protein EMIHUDRAFT_104216 [Emiliania huxleyi CCMP1516]|eukprot:XP_005764765.1 hypothetical protein EMIHUDRAFT_104216 [Emiliania huxleyi CCMP1516]
MLAAALVSQHRLRPSPPRAPPARLNWLADLFSPVAADSAAAELVLSELCEPEWAIRCELGAAVASSLGGSGSLARGRTDASTDVRLDCGVRFEIDAGFDPPQGTVRLARPSRLLAAEGFWKISETDDRDVPKAISWRLQSTGIRAGEEELVPPGPLYFNALLEGDGSTLPLQLTAGRLTVKEDIGADVGIFRARGILAEFKIVGAFEAQRAIDPAQPPAS